MSKIDKKTLYISAYPLRISVFPLLVLACPGYDLTRDFLVHVASGFANQTVYGSGLSGLQKWWNTIKRDINLILSKGVQDLWTPYITIGKNLMLLNNSSKEGSEEILCE